MVKRSKVFSLASGLAVLIIAFMFSSCSTNSPLAPDPVDIGPVSKGISMGIEPIVYTQTDRLVDCNLGGTIEIERDGTMHEFRVDAGALDQDTRITIITSEQKINGKDAVVFEFGPNGLIFKKAAKLDFDIADLNASIATAKLLYYEPGLRVWVNQGSKSVTNGRAVFDIYHFSKYAISD